jgi:hypothetical protein
MEAAAADLGCRLMHCACAHQALFGRLQADNPQSILLNGRGFYQDCMLGPGGNTKNITCNATSQWVPPGRSALQP